MGNFALHCPNVIQQMGANISTVGQVIKANSITKMPLSTEIDGMIKASSLTRELPLSEIAGVINANSLTVESALSDMSGVIKANSLTAESSLSDVASVIKANSLTAESSLSEVAGVIKASSLTGTLLSEKAGMIKASSLSRGAFRPRIDEIIKASSLVGESFLSEIDEMIKVNSLIQASFLSEIDEVVKASSLAGKLLQSRIDQLYGLDKTIQTVSTEKIASRTEDLQNIEFSAKLQPISGFDSDRVEVPDNYYQSVEMATNLQTPQPDALHVNSVHTAEETVQPPPKISKELLVALIALLLQIYSIVQGHISETSSIKTQVQRDAITSTYVEEIIDNQEAGLALETQEIDILQSIDESLKILIDLFETSEDDIDAVAEQNPDTAEEDSVD